MAVAKTGANFDTKQSDVFRKIDIKLAVKISPFFRRKLVTIAENSYHNIGPLFRPNFEDTENNHCN
jgi:ABC-type enterochelin transport system substrate-binding protein